MSREMREWHPKFKEYMEMIIHHPNYRGLPIEKKQDGSYGWLATAKSVIGRKRIEWCLDKAREMGIPIRPGVYADVMLAIHPTKWKVCQTCGREMSLFYLYPNTQFLKKLNERFGTRYTSCDSICDIWDDLAANGVPQREIAQFLIAQGGLDLPDNADKNAVIEALEYACRKYGKKSLGPGAMSNFPDRFDGFHSYNRCCRGTQDKGRFQENLKTYTKDRRAYEYWSDGNIHAANQFMGSTYFDGISADHIGPVSLGFVHDPRYLKPMCGGDNSAKRDRLRVEDVEKILETERRTGIYPMSWHAAKIWEHIKAHYMENPSKVNGVYRDALKQNMTDYMFVLWSILERCSEKGKSCLIDAFLKPKFSFFDYEYTFNAHGEIIGEKPRHYTERSRHETDRYCRIAIASVYEYMEKENRNTAPDLTRTEKELLGEICDIVNAGCSSEIVKEKIAELLEKIQDRLLEKL